MFSRNNLTDLINAAPTMSVSIYLPTYTHGRETRQNPIMLKNLLGQARDQLAERGLPEPETETILSPAVALIEDNDFWQHQDLGLVLFLSDAGLQSFKLPIPVPELAVAGPRFHIGPLLALQEPDATFVILTVTADATQVWHATRFRISPAQVTDLPASLESLNEAPDYEGPLQSHGFGRPNTGGQSMPKTQVYGDSPEEWRKGRLLEYARRTAVALAAELARDPQRVVVVADAEIGGHLVNDAALVPLIAGYVEINPSSLDEAGLHAAAYAVMQPLHDITRDEALDRVAALVGRKDATACMDPAMLRTAAQDGKIDQLFVDGYAILGEKLEPEAGDTKTRDPVAPETADTIDQTAQMTLLNGGKVWVVPPDHLPNGSLMAAILRY